MGGMTKRNSPIVKCFSMLTNASRRFTNVCSLTFTMKAVYPSDLRKKVACIPGQYLDYTSANQLSGCLDDLESFIKQEDKEYYHAD